MAQVQKKGDAMAVNVRTAAGVKKEAEPTQTKAATAGEQPELAFVY